MLLNLLADRFQMKAHLEKKEMQAFALVVAKGGVKMKPSAETPSDVGALPLPPGPPKLDKNGFPIVTGQWNDSRNAEWTGAPGGETDGDRPDLQLSRHPVRAARNSTKPV